MRGLVAMMRTPAATGGPVNLGNPAECTMLELARQVIRMCESGSGIVHRPLPDDDPVRRRPDISLARRLLGWSPEIALEEGLERTIGWFRQQLRMERAILPRGGKTAASRPAYIARS